MLTTNVFVNPQNMGIEPKFIVLSQKVQNLWSVQFLEIMVKYAYLAVISRNDFEMAIDLELIEIEQ